MTGENGSPGLRRWLLAVSLALALAVRLLAWYQFGGVEGLHGDEKYYVGVGRSIAAGEGHPGSLRPPLYPAFIGAIFTLWGDHPDTVRLVQVGLGLLPVAVIFQICARRFGVGAAFLSAVACGLSPALIHHTHFLWAESLLAVLLALVVWLLDAFDRRAEPRLAAAAGLFLGLAALTREEWLYFALPAALWVASRAGWRSRRAVATTTLFLACTLLPVLPWTARNYRLHRRPVLISTLRWMPIAQGNLMPRSGWLLGAGPGAGRRRGAPDGELEQAAYWRRIALRAIAAEQPGWIVKKTLRNTRKLFVLKTQALRFLKKGWLPEPGPLSARLLVIAEVGGYLLTLVPGLAGLWLVPGGRIKKLVVAIILYKIAIHVVANAVPRFHVPLLPWFCLYLGPLVCRRVPLRDAPAWRWLGAAASVAALLGIVASGWGADVVSAWRIAVGR